MLLLRTSTGEQTARLSAGARSVAYRLAASGPAAVGVLHDVTRSWCPSVLILLLLLVQTAAGARGARNHLVLGRPTYGGEVKGSVLVLLRTPSTRR